MELKFSEHFIAEDVCLFEIPNESLLQALMEEQGVEIRGKQGCESSVLVTKDST